MKVVDYAPKVFVATFGHRLSESQKELMQFCGAPVGVCDRTDTLNLGFAQQKNTPIPAFSPNSMTFTDCMDERAAELIAEGHPIAVYWSGGIDSTAVLVSLLKARAHDQLTVHYNTMSRFENPEFFKNYIEGKVQTQQVSSDVLTNMPKDCLVVTGELGDQIFGSVMTMGEFPDSPQDARKKHWKDMIRNPSGTWVPRVSDQSIEMLELLASKCPFPVVSAYDFLWWNGFINKWQTVESRMGFEFGSDFDVYRKNIRHFFGTDAFQQWSMNPDNQVLKVGNDWRSYKMPAKEYIFAFDGNAKYRDEKRKKGSLPTSFYGSYLMRLDNGDKVVLTDATDFKRVYDARFGTKYDTIFNHI